MQAGVHLNVFLTLKWCEQAVVKKVKINVGIILISTVHVCKSNSLMDL